MPAFSERLQKIKPTIFSHMTNLANQHGAINLSQGFPDFDGPDFIKNAAIEAIRGDKNQYAPSAGIQELREAIVDKYKRFYGLEYDSAKEVTVVSGATEAIFSTMFALLNPGDEVILFEPCYDAYLALCHFTGAVPKFIRLHSPNFAFNLEDLKNAMTSRTKCLVINTPHNPSGKLFSKKELEDIGKLSMDNDCFIITDEVYEHITYEKNHVPMATFPRFRDHVITISSTAKTFSFTGWKIGYLLAPEDISKQIRLVHQFVTFSTATPLQHAMIEAFRAPSSYYDALKSDYWKKRDLLGSILQEAGFKTILPEGSYYIVTDISEFTTMNDLEFCEFLIKDVGVAAIPMSPFYCEESSITNLVRFCFAKQDDVLINAGRRLKSLREKLNS
ncbi:MAG: methionine aminotransferase [Candidatus Helarchaeota archaeon]